MALLKLRSGNKAMKASGNGGNGGGAFPFVNIRQLGPIAAAMTRLGQLWQRPPDTISSINPSQWPSALQPVAPLGQPGSQPLAWQYMMGQNLMYTPRPDAEYGFNDLRSLAKYPLARVCIENTKAQISRIPWKVQLKAQVGESKSDRNKKMKGDSNIKTISQFFEYPDRDNMYCWSDWVRPLLEAMLVIDAATIYVRKTLGGTLASLIVLSGADITVLIDDNGFRPKPPNPAYQQLWEGVPRCNLTSDQLIYRPRNIVYRNTISSHLYGMSPTEQLAQEITVGALRLRYVLAFYETGSVPGIMHVVPPGVHPDKIKETMEWMNSDLAGQLEKRRQWRMIQGFREDKDDQIIQLKDPVLADVYDDLHIRKVCFGYGTSPQRLMRMMNRASAQQNQESAEEEGLLPWVTWLKSVMDYIIQVVMGYVDYEMSFDTSVELDIVKQATAYGSYVKDGIYPINWVHEQMGEDLDTNPLANELLQFLPTGVQPLGAPPPMPPGAGEVGPDGKPVKPTAPEQSGPRGNPQGSPGGKGTPGAGGAPSTKLGKFDDNEARDEQGRWTSGGFGSYEETLKSADRDYFSYEQGAAMRDSIADGGIEKGYQFTDGSIATEEEASKINAQAAALQKAASSTITSHRELWRGIRVNDEGLSKFKVGQRVEFGTLTSTSPDRSIANIYASNDPTDGELPHSVLFRIERPSGIKGYARVEGDMERSGMHSEVVLPKGASYRVSYVRQEHGRNIVGLYDSSKK